MQKIVYSLIVVLLLAGCAVKNAVAKKYNLPTTIAYSNGFAKFMEEFNIETQGLTSLDDYVPSNTMKKEFEIVVMPDGQVGVKGFIQVIPSIFDAYTFEHLDGYLTYYDEGIYEYKIPVKNIRQMLDVKGLVQVDIPQKRLQ